MFDRCTESSRRAFARARKEAQYLDHDFISTAHVLLGLIDGCPGDVLPWMDTALADRKAVLKSLRAQIPRGEGTLEGSLLFTSAARQALECTAEAGSVCRDQGIEPHHILLGLALESHGRAAGLLRERGVSAQKLALRLLEAKQIPPYEGEAVLQGLLEIATRSRVEDDDRSPSTPLPRKAKGWLWRWLGR